MDAGIGVQIGNIQRNAAKSGELLGVAGIISGNSLVYGIETGKLEVGPGRTSPELLPDVSVVSFRL